MVDRFHLQETIDKVSDQQVRDRIANMLSDEKLVRLDVTAARQFYRRRFAEWVVAGAAFEYVKRDAWTRPTAFKLTMNDVAFMGQFLASRGLPLKSDDSEMRRAYDVVIAWMKEDGLPPSLVAKWLVMAGKSSGEEGASVVFQRRLPSELDALVRQVSTEWGMSRSASVAYLGTLTAQIPEFHDFVRKARERARGGFPPKRPWTGRPPKDVHRSTTCA